jgi:hypothetical protein
MQQYPRVPEWVKDEIAWWIVCDMCRRLGELGGRRDDPATWERLARSYGADVDRYHKPGGIVGRHLRQWGTVAYNTARGTWSQCKALCHEITRYILWHWTPPRLLSGADGHCYNDDPSRVCHQIAQRVDGVML